MSVLSPERERPVSGGLWSLLGWLRRGERGSTDSLSSGGSDRTTASFAFLPPHRYRHAAAPLPLRPPAPPTDTYKKRLRDTNIRRHYERDITLHRKYRLPLGEGGPAFDALTLPSVRRSVSLAEGKQEREKRATSESLQRRAPHVPGKRRAPPPPAGLTAAAAAAAAGSAPRRRAVKRPAPQPPHPLHLRATAQHNTLPRIKQKENSDQMTSKSSARDLNPLDGDKTADCKSEKYSRKESQTQPKLRQEKSFLRQIFENRKRNSAIEPTTVKLLPNISELDRQAAELMQTFKLKAFERGDDPAEESNNDKHSNFKGDAWFCTRCLKKYDSTMVTCLDCLSQAKVSTDSAKHKDKCLGLKNIYTQINVNTTDISSSSKDDERQRLKEMLKEMKNSLPKRPQAENSNADKIVMTFKDGKNNSSKETPTLPMGSSILNDFKFDPKPSSSKENFTVSIADNMKDNTPRSSHATETVLVTRTIVLTDPGLRIVKNHEIPQNHVIENMQSKNRQNLVLNIAPLTPTSNRNEPLKISSLLNPIYIPKSASNILNSQSNNFAAKKSFLERSYPVTETTSVAGATTGTAQVTRSNPVTETTSVAGATTGTAQVTRSNPVTETTSVAGTTTGTAQVTRSNPVTETTSVAGTTTGTAQVTRTKSSLEGTTSTQGQKLQEVQETPPSSFNISTVPTPAHSNYIKITSNQLKTSTATTNQEPETQQTKIGTNIQNYTSASNGISSTSPTQKIPIKKSVQSTKPEIVKTEISTESENKEASPKFTPGLLCKRRELINQLEKSIASGDERAAAEAAIRLAQLKMACSVLSYSSQIISEDTPSNLSVETTLNTPTVESMSSNAVVAKVTLSKVNSSTQSVGTKCVKVIPSTSNSTLPPKDITKEKRNVYPTKEPSPLKITTTATKDPSKSNAKPSTLPKSGSFESHTFPIEVWVEDREAARGPITLSVPRGCTLGLLRRQAEASLRIPGRLQRWVVGRALCNDDAATLASLAGPTFDAPFYLCLVESAETRQDANSTAANNITKKHSEEQGGEVYYELVQLELRALVSNTEAFECSVCLEDCEAGAGAVLRECVHAFCRGCLAASIGHCEEPAVACPATGCPGTLQEREIRSLVSAAEYERWLARGLAAAESGSRHAFHCRTSDCAGWALCEPGVRRFPCPVCRANNCVPCQAIHEGETCEQHRARLREAAAAAASTGVGDRTDDGTRALLASLIARGEALECPECSAVITKKWGCDWVRCSACKTEICWVTRGRRWGPAGRGDTSAGCRCGVDGKRCHPSCCYCH